MLTFHWWRGCFSQAICRRNISNYWGLEIRNPENTVTTTCNLCCVVVRFSLLVVYHVVVVNDPS